MDVSYGNVSRQVSTNFIRNRKSDKIRSKVVATGIDEYESIVACLTKQMMCGWISAYNDRIEREVCMHV